MVFTVLFITKRGLDLTDFVVYLQGSLVTSSSTLLALSLWKYNSDHVKVASDTVLVVCS